VLRQRLILGFSPRADSPALSSSTSSTWSRVTMDPTRVRQRSELVGDEEIAITDL
jgi:hypothetical protein